MDIAIFLYLTGFLGYFKALSEDDYELFEFAASFAVSLFWPILTVLEVFDVTDRP